MFNKRESSEARSGDKERQQQAVAGQKAAPSSKAGAQTAVIGPSIHVDGKLRGDEDLLIEGKVKGTVEFKKHSVTIGANGDVKADIFAHTIYVDGAMEGNLVASERIVVRQSARVRGSIASPRVSLEDGARFNGTIDMDSESEALAKTFGVSKSANGSTRSSAVGGESVPNKKEAAAPGQSPNR